MTKLATGAWALAVGWALGGGGCTLRSGASNPGRTQIQQDRVVDEFRSVQLEGAFHVDVSVGSPQRVTLEGRASTLERVKTSVTVELVGAGSLDAVDLLAQTVDIAIVGAGVANVTALARLDTEIVGTGHVRHRGDPAVEKSVHGAGRVRRF